MKGRPAPRSQPADDRSAQRGAGRPAPARQVADALRARLVSGEEGWSYGDRIPSQARLAAELGVGRAAVRDALELLTGEGWLAPGRGNSTVVAREVGPVPGPLPAARQAEVLDVIEARRALESEAARLAALRRTGHDLAAIDEALRRRRQAVASDDVRAAVTADTDFHSAIVRAAGNAVLAELFESLDRDITAMLVDLHAHDMVSEESAAAHEDLALAIEVQDPEGATAATRRQFASAERQLRLGTSG